MLFTLDHADLLMEAKFKFNTCLLFSHSLSLLKECVVGELGGVGGLNKESSLVENDEIIAAFSLGSPGPRGCQLRDN